jgi:hypothetical protein
MIITRPSLSLLNTPVSFLLSVSLSFNCRLLDDAKGNRLIKLDIDMLKGLAYRTKVLFYEVYIIDNESFYQHPFCIKVGGNAEAKFSLFHTDIAMPMNCTDSSRARMLGQMVVVVKAKLIERQRRKELAILDQV